MDPTEANNNNEVAAQSSESNLNEAEEQVEDVLMSSLNRQISEELPQNSYYHRDASANSVGNKNDKTDFYKLKIKHLMPVDSLINYRVESSTPTNKAVNSSRIKYKTSSVKNGMFHEHNVYRVVQESNIIADDSVSTSSGIMTASDLNENIDETAFYKNKEKSAKEKDSKIYKLSKHEQIDQIKSPQLTKRDCKKVEFGSSSIDMINTNNATRISSNDKISDKIDENDLKRKQQTAWSSNFAKNVPKTLKLPRRKKFSGVKSKLNPGAIVTSTNYGRNYQSVEPKRKNVLKESLKEYEKKEKASKIPRSNHSSVRLSFRKSLSSSKSTLRSSNSLSTEKPNRLELLAILEKLRNERKLKEKEREGVMRIAKNNQLKLNQKRNKSKDLWKRRFFEEKKKTAPLADVYKDLRNEYETKQRRLMQLPEIQSAKFKKNFSRHIVLPSIKNSSKIEAGKLQYEIQMTKRQVEAAKNKLTGEMKLRHQAENDVKILREELLSKKIRANVAYRDLEKARNIYFYKNESDLRKRFV